MNGTASATARETEEKGEGLSATGRIRLASSSLPYKDGNVSKHRWGGNEGPIIRHLDPRSSREKKRDEVAKKRMLRASRTAKNDVLLELQNDWLGWGD